MTSKKAIPLKAALYLVDIMLILGLETSVLPRMGMAGWTPVLLFYIAAAAAVFDGAAAGGLVGFACGLFTDALCGSTLLYYTVAMTALSALAGYISPLLFRRKVMTAAGWGLLAAVAAETGRFVFFIYLFNKAPFSALFTAVMPACGVGALFSLPIAAAVKLISKIGRAAQPSLFSGRIY